MKYLLDTMVWLWSVGPLENIGDAGLEVIENGDSEIYLSVVSSWEIAIKARLGKYNLPESPDRYVPKKLAKQGIRPLQVSLDHSLKVFGLPLHHHDPFDHLLIAQGMAEEMVILTSDRVFAKYPVEVLWCGTQRSGMTK
jgi:PIN domain nuclease of toxin-antitoxin system